MAILSIVGIRLMIQERNRIDQEKASIRSA